jgi:hypothetical protein
MELKVGVSISQREYTSSTRTLSALEIYSLLTMDLFERLLGPRPIGQLGPSGPIGPLDPLGPFGTLGPLGPLGPLGTLGPLGPLGYFI